MMLTSLHLFKGRYLHDVVANVYNRLVTVGGFNTVATLTRNGIFVTNNTSGTEDTSFHSTMGSAFNGVPIVAKSNSTGTKLYVGGTFTSYNSNASHYLIVLNSNGSVNLTFPNKFDASVEALYIHDDGSMVVGGNFTTFNGMSFNRLIKLTPEGYIDGSFVVGSGFDSGTRDISFDGEYYYITGPFTTYQGISSKGIVKLDIGGNLIQWGNFTCDFTYYNKLDGNGNIYIGGQNMTAYNGTSIAPNLTKLSTSNLSLNTTFSTNLNGPSGGVNSRVANFSIHNGYLYIGGSFTGVANQFKYYLAKISTDGVLDATFPINVPNLNTRFATLINNNNLLAIGGSFTDFAGSSSRDRFAVVDLDGTVQTGWNRDFYGSSNEPYNVCEIE